MNVWSLIIVLAVLFSEFIEAKILIMTSAYNRPDFIALQHKAFKKYIEDEYEFIVFNDAIKEQHARDITETCVSLNIPCIPVPQENRTKVDEFKRGGWASWRHAEAIQYMMHYASNYSGLVMLIDSDMFPIKKFSVAKFLGSYDIAGLRSRSRDGLVEYPWPGLIFMNMNTLPKKETMCFLPKTKDSYVLDSGSSMHDYLRKNPTIKKFYFGLEGRLLFNENLYPMHSRFCNSTSRFQVKCSDCLMLETKYDHECLHKNKVLKELGLSDDIINLIIAKKFPASEFVLGDTFFHAVASSGYNTTTPLAIKKKNALVLAFMDYVLAEDA